MGVYACAYTYYTDHEGNGDRASPGLSASPNLQVLCADNDNGRLV